MPTFQDARIQKSTGVEYRYVAEYAEEAGRATWSAAVSLHGRRVHRLSGSVDVDADTAVCSAVASSVRARIDETRFS